MDCKINAIAFITDLSYGKDPPTYQYSNTYTTVLVLNMFLTSSTKNPFKEFFHEYSCILFLLVASLYT